MRYYLFGDEPCKAFGHGDVATCKTALKRYEGSLYAWDGVDANDLLYAFDGWNCWLEITSKQYNLLSLSVLGEPN